MWTQPWGYREGFAIPLGLLLLGLMLHFSLGTLQPTEYAYPLNLLGGLLLLLLSVALGGLAQRSAVARFFCSHYAAVGGMAVWGVVMLVMGLTRQIAVEQVAAHGLTDWVHRLGLSHILSTRYFLLLYLYVLWTLGGVTVKGLLRALRGSARAGRGVVALSRFHAQRLVSSQSFRALHRPLGRTCRSAPDRKISVTSHRRRRLPRVARA